MFLSTATVHCHKRLISLTYYHFAFLEVLLILEVQAATWPLQQEFAPTDKPIQHIEISVSVSSMPIYGDP